MYIFEEIEKNIVNGDFSYELKIQYNKKARNIFIFKRLSCIQIVEKYVMKMIKQL